MESSFRHFKERNILVNKSAFVLHKACLGLDTNQVETKVIGLLSYPSGSHLDPSSQDKAVGTSRIGWVWE